MTDPGDHPMPSQPASPPPKRPPSARRRQLAGAALAAGALSALAPCTAPAAIIPAPGPWPTNIIGAANPLIGTPFALNGSNATVNADLRIWLPHGGQRRGAVTRTVGDSTVIRGRLRNRDTRRSIAGATLTLAAQDVYTPDWNAVANTRTNRHGNFRVVLGPGYHRRVGVIYYPSVTAVSPLYSRRLLIRAKTRVVLAAPYHKRRAYRFDGQVSAGVLPIPSTGLLIALQVRNRRGNYVTARLQRTTANGRFRIRYTFPTRNPLRVRVFVPAQTDWAIFAGTSRARYILPR